MMGQGLTLRSSVPDEVWDEVWQNYDARTRPPPQFRFQAVPLEHERTRQRRSRMLLVGLTALSLLLLAATAYAAAPVQAARDVAKAFRTADRLAVAAMVDWDAVRAAARRPAPAEDFLAGLSRIVEDGRATPEGLLALVQARVGPDWPAARIEPAGFASIRLMLDSPSRPGHGVALSLALRDCLPPRWLVVAAEPFG